jgi:hypothetical protein
LSNKSMTCHSRIFGSEAEFWKRVRISIMDTEHLEKCQRRVEPFQITNINTRRT